MRTSEAEDGKAAQCVQNQACGKNHDIRDRHMPEQIEVFRWHTFVCRGEIEIFRPWRRLTSSIYSLEQQVSARFQDSRKCEDSVQGRVGIAVFQARNIAWQQVRPRG